MHPRPTSVRSTADLARYVGLARSTVSRVLNGHAGVKPKSIEIVRRAIEETGFAPNAHAMGLRGKGIKTVGICMETLLTPPMVAKLAALQSRLRARGIVSLIEVLEPGESRQVLQHFRSMQASGVVFIGHFEPAELAAAVADLRNQQVAHVLVDQTGIEGANTVSIDRRRAMREMVKCLVDLGHRTFALLGLNKPVESVRRRLAGINDGLREAGLDIAACTLSLDHLEMRDQDFTFGRRLAAAFARRPDRPTAMIALNDVVAVGALLGLQEAGLRVPDDVSVTGFNNQDICLMTTPTVTSVDQRIEATADEAAEVLFDQLARLTGEPVVRMIESPIVKRNSIGPVARRR